MAAGIHSGWRSSISAVACSHLRKLADVKGHQGFGVLQNGTGVKFLLHVLSQAQRPYQ